MQDPQAMIIADENQVTIDCVVGLARRLDELHIEIANLKRSLEFSKLQCSLHKKSAERARQRTTDIRKLVREHCDRETTAQILGKYAEPS